MKSAVFFERDGILNFQPVGSRNPVGPITLDGFQPNQEAIEPLQRLKAAGFVLIATTNQPGLSRGTQCRRELERMHNLLRQRLGLDDILVCPHDEGDRCPCRKPKPGLFIEAAFKWHLDLEHCFVVSDKWFDAHAAHVVGCTSLLIKSPWIGSGHHDFVLSDIAAAANKILRLNSQPVCSAG
jgi:D-glycero-D-manno-heptose 1,7-bisphosphate phosphatase